MNRVREIPLTKGYVAIVDAADYDAVVLGGPWHVFDSGERRTRYARHSISSRERISLHKFLTGWAYTDHINGDGLDNRRANLRESDHHKNMRNTRPRLDTTSQFKGVYHRADLRRPWVAQINPGGPGKRRNKYLGSFLTELDAARAFDAAAFAIAGEHAWRNFPDEHRVAS